MITARGGSGIVIARLSDGRWSAPSAIGIAGLGGGFEIGVEVSDLVIILNHRRAIDAFAKGGNLTLGGNCTVAVGPLGRFYSQDIRALSILNGDVEPPPAAHELYTILDDYTEKYTTDWQRKNLRRTTKVTLCACYVKPSLYPNISSLKSDSPAPSRASPGLLVVTAMHPFVGQQPGDLSFNVGDRITVTTKTDSQYDWWEGQLHGQVGIFPANFVSYS
ncbi:hypothetical protein JZ751_004496 [Albula glossodonta]|uniref:SH3 domain-containing YSC84-like protein 1 n=1 Tax=Albula glossodonta TaxID=121402 RepID=A0A8T2MMS2_9TELE|nr:hypothetical protein JZ751_004496 [Albula glossodonta]